MRDGEQYLAYERAFRRNNRPTDLKEIVMVMKWRSADFRILHCLIHQLIGKAYAPTTFQAYEAFEMLMEIDDDINSYAQDSAAGTFNFLRALSLLPSTQPNETATLFRQDLLQQIHDLRKALPPEQSSAFSLVLQQYSELVPEPMIPSNSAEPQFRSTITSNPYETSHASPRRKSRRAA